MVEVDVRQQQVTKIADGEAMYRQPGLELVDARRRSAVNQRRLVARQQVARDHPGVPEEVEVEELGSAT
jgi:hypothetical protein